VALAPLLEPDAGAGVDVVAAGVTAAGAGASDPKK